MKTPPWVKWTMTPTWAAVTKRLVDDLHAHLIIGLNMESDSIQVAQAELHGSRRNRRLDPDHVRVGNEPELRPFPFYHAANGAAVLGRPKTYSLREMSAMEWNHLVDARPRVRLAGPGYSGLRGARRLAIPGKPQTGSHRGPHSNRLKSSAATAARWREQLFNSQSLQALSNGSSGRPLRATTGSGCASTR